MTGEYASKESVQKIFGKLDEQDKAIDSLKEKIYQVQEQVSITSTVVESLKELPKLFTDLQLTLQNVDRNLDKMNMKVDNSIEQVKRVEEKVDGVYNQKVANLEKRVQQNAERGKVDIVNWLSSKWFEIVLGVSMVMMFFKDKV